MTVTHAEIVAALNESLRHLERAQIRVAELTMLDMATTAFEAHPEARYLALTEQSPGRFYVTCVLSEVEVLMEDGDDFHSVSALHLPSPAVEARLPYIVDRSHLCARTRDYDETNRYLDLVAVRIGYRI